MFNTVRKQFYKNKLKTIFIALIITLMSGVLLYVFSSLNIKRGDNFRSIEELPKDRVILTSGMFRGKEELLKENYNVSFYKDNTAFSNNINIWAVSENAFENGLIYDYDFKIETKNVKPLEVLEGSLDFENILNPIVIDDYSALKLFNRVDVVGETIEIYLEDIKVDFEVIAVIKENPNRIRMLKTSEKLGYDKEAVIFSNAYILDTTYKELTTNEVFYNYAQIVFLDDVKKEDIELLLTLLETNLKESKNYLLSYNFLQEKFNSDFRNSLLYNLASLALPIIAFMGIIIYSAKSKLKDFDEDLLKMNEEGIKEKPQVNLILLYWRILLHSSILISAVIVGIIMFVILDMSIKTYFLYYLFYIVLLMAFLDIIIITTISYFSYKYVINFKLNLENKSLNENSESF